MIAFKCPHCEFPYKLKDELAGKRATCKNPSCRQVLTIPAPNTNGLRIADLGGIAPEESGRNDTPLPSNPADIESAALAALAETAKEEEKSADDIQMICPHCDHKWTEPISKAGKNTLCPNPECRQRIKVPELKKGQTREDWRSTASGKPSLAKENFEKPTDVMDAEAKVVSREAYIQGGGAEQDYEPVPLKRKLFVWSLIVAPILVIAVGVWVFISWRGETGEELTFDTALKQYADGRGELDPVQGALGSAILELAAGEHALGARKMDKDKALTLAHQHFTKARTQIQEAAQKDDKNKATGERYALAGELALAVVGLGGTDEQVKAGERFRWVPESTGGRPLRVNERVHTVHEELRLVLLILQGADFDTKAVVLRRLTRALGKAGQASLAAEVPVFLFNDAEMPEAKAIVALELYRPTRSGADGPAKIAEELKAILAGGATGRNPPPASAQTLWNVLGTEKVPTLFPQPAGNQFSEGSRYAYVGQWILQDKTAEALDLARKPGTLPGQLRALALYAEWAPDPGPAFEAAISLTSLAAKTKKETPPAPVLLRLSQLAATTGRMDAAKQLADLIPDEGLKTWAKGSAFQFSATPENKNKVEDAALEVPDAGRIRAGHLWGRLWQARQNARQMGTSNANKAIIAWPKGTVQPFGLAGIALAQHDK
jgi:hypothetical protein